MRSFAKMTLGLAALVAGTVPATADDSVCHSVDVTLKPQKRTDLRLGRQQPPQMVAWIEDASGVYVATIFITQATGTYGLGNRPGRSDFNSAPRWPYGRRVNVFPVWAERKPERYDTIVFQDRAEDNLSHRYDQSSPEPHFCRPMEASTNPDKNAYDAMTCASAQIFSDKGERDATVQTKYPPRQDIAQTPNTDVDDVSTYPSMNKFDAVSTATPASGMVTTFGWTMPSDLAAGNYVLWVEASTEFDHNDTYTEAARPAPTNISYGDYGEPYRGQPSVVYKVPFAISGSAMTTRTSDYVGYGDPDGASGVLNAPDATISTTVAGSGVDRLGVISDPDGDYRIKVVSRMQLDSIAPGVPQQFALASATSRSAVIDFVEAGDDANVGTVRSYDVRLRTGSPITDDNFDAPDTLVLPSTITPVMAGEQQQIEISALLPATHYYVAVRANDDCDNKSPLATYDFSTPDRAVGEVDACFVATAAYGSMMAADVGMLRHMRDSVMRKSVLGELAVEAYYTFSPPVAGVVGESELLRWTARSVLEPVVRKIRAFSF
ncbi:MAG TPA: CFI-box-CTERM domain-containing protein [Kofleriaceae bacterium]|jgi:hypothetical protein